MKKLSEFSKIHNISLETQFGLKLVLTPLYEIEALGSQKKT